MRYGRDLNLGTEEIWRTADGSSPGFGLFLIWDLNEDKLDEVCESLQRLYKNIRKALGENPPVIKTTTFHHSFLALDIKEPGDADLDKFSVTELSRLLLALLHCYIILHATVQTDKGPKPGSFCARFNARTGQLKKQQKLAIPATSKISEIVNEYERALEE